MAIYFEEEYAHNKSGSFVSIHKRMIADNSHRVGSRHIHSVRSVTVHIDLLRASKGGPKKPHVPDAGSTTIERQKPIMERESITLVNPDGFSHLASECRVLR